MRIKFPRTPHLASSPGFSTDDCVRTSIGSLLDSDVVITEKMDGENTTMYRDAIHARSLDSVDHPSRSWVKNFWSSIKSEIPAGWRICGENLYAQHSVKYPDLPTYFMGFSVWNSENHCLSWSDTILWFNLLGITPVPVIITGMVSVATLEALGPELAASGSEGFVVRPMSGFGYDEYGSVVAKWVRTGHVTTDQHWMNSRIVKNGLRQERK